MEEKKKARKEDFVIFVRRFALRWLCDLLFSVAHTSKMMKCINVDIRVIFSLFFISLCNGCVVDLLPCRKIYFLLSNRKSMEFINRKTLLHCISLFATSISACLPLNFNARLLWLIVKLLYLLLRDKKRSFKRISRSEKFCLFDSTQFTT